MDPQQSSEEVILTEDSSLDGKVEVEITSSLPPGYWDGMVAAHPFGRFEDTVLRQEAFCRCHPETRRFYLLAKIRDRVVGCLGFCETFFGHDIFTWNKTLRPFSAVLRRGMRTFDAFTAPLVFAYQREGEIIGAFLEALDRLAKERHIYLSTHLRYPSPGAEPALPEAFFLARGFHHKPHGTYLIDLSKDLDELWSNLKQEARTSVRKATKQGISVSQGKTEEDYTRYYQLFLENRLRDHKKSMFRPLYSEDTITDHVRFFDAQGVLKLFCAWKDGEMGSCTMAKYFNGIVSFNSHARGDQWHRSNLHDGDLLCWEMIRWAKEQGHRYFDMTGFDVVPANDRQRGIQRFKSKWGGERVYYNYYSKVYGGARERIVSWARTLRA